MLSSVAKKVIALGFVFISSALSADILDRFLPDQNQGISSTRVNTTLPPIPAVKKVKVSPENFNQAVELNNLGLRQMEAKNFAVAAEKFAAACRKAPSETGFWTNRLLALKKLNGREDECLKISRRILASDPKNFQAAYLAGVILLNDYKKPELAVPYLNLAHRLKPEDPNFAVALATSYDQAGDSDSAFALLKQYAHQIQGDPYPFYLLGLQYLKREDYNPAIRSFKTAKMRDEKGYVHDAYIRAKYFAGQLDGLDMECRDALIRFPDIINRESLERIYFSIKPNDFEFFETITIQVSEPESLEKMDFLVKLPPEIKNHQSIDLIEALVIKRDMAKRIKSKGQDLNGKLRFETPKDFISSTFHLRLNYRIRTTALLGSRISGLRVKRPDLKELTVDPRLSLDHPMVQSLADKLSRLPGNYLQNCVKAIAKGLGYKENFEDKSVAWAFSHLDQCDCTEYSRLLASLCLIRGIPARVVTGFLVKPELMRKETSIGHAWCEVFIDGKGWFPIDPTLQPTMHWAYFGNLLTDQIVFDYLLSGKRSRISVDFISTRPELQVKISNSYKISEWK